MGRPSTPLDLITNVWPASDSDQVQDLTNGGAHFGPFNVGDMVRVTTLIGDIWAAVVPDKNTTITARSVGIPIAAGTYQDFQIQDETKPFFYLIMDTAGTNAYAIAVKTGERMSDVDAYEVNNFQPHARPTGIIPGNC